MLPVALAALAALCVLVLVFRRPSHPLPPGPRGLPILGNMAERSSMFDFKKFPEVRARYGDITSITVLGKTIVTLHTYEKAVEVLDKKGLIHSARPTMEVLNLSGWEDHLLFIPNERQLLDCRKMMRAELNHDKIGQFHADQEVTTLRFLRLMRDNPEKCYELAEWHVGSILLKVVYGYETREENDPMINLVHHGLGSFIEATAFGGALELIPWLRLLPAWFPGAGFKRLSGKWRQDYGNMRDIPYESAVQKMKTDSSPNFITKWIGQMRTPKDISNLKHTATAFYSGGVETTSLTLQTFFFRMQERLDIQKQAQKELDDVVGFGQLPTFADRENLPYINAIVKELLRHTPAAPTGMPHKSTADDIQDGYFIPKGTVVVPSIAEMANDPDVYTNPEAFNPSRFMGPKPERDPKLYVFGFGRRICTGIDLAEESLYLTITAVLSTMQILPCEIPAKLEYTEGLVSHPLPFKCLVTPRPGVHLDEIL